LRYQKLVDLHKACHLLVYFVIDKGDVVGGFVLLLGRLGRHQGSVVVSDNVGVPAFVSLDYDLAVPCLKLISYKLFVVE
jgi:hypothetical protein